MLACNRTEGFIGALQDALGSDVDPGTSSHLAIHGQAFCLELAELWPSCPVAHQVGVSNEDTWCPLVRAEDTYGFARLHQKSLIGFQRLQGAHDGVVCFPGAGSFTCAAINNKLLWVLGNLRVEVVHEHAHGRFGLPVLGSQLVSACGANGARS